MSDDLSKRGPQDRSRINVNEAVKAVGPSATAVREHLGN